MLDLIPYRPLSSLVRAIRIRYYTKPWPEDVPSIVVDASADYCDAALRTWFGFESVPYSYRYEGEVLNLRRPEGTDSAGRQLELHVRGRATAEDLELIAHVEASRYEHKRVHIEGVSLQWLDEAELAFFVVSQGGDPLSTFALFTVILIGPEAVETIW